MPASSQKDPGQNPGIADSSSMALGKLLIPQSIGEQQLSQCSHTKFIVLLLL